MDSPAGERSRGVESDLGPALYEKRKPGRLGGSGQGASLSMPVTIDNTAPTLDGVSVDPIQKTMTVKAHDNQYIAAGCPFQCWRPTVLDFDGTRDGVKRATPAHMNWICRKPMEINSWFRSLTTPIM